MKLKTVCAAIAASSLMLTPVAASAAAAPLSVTDHVRAEQAVEGQNDLFGGGAMGIALTAALAAALLYVAYEVFLDDGTNAEPQPASP